jgi:hypothetical protein
LLRFPRLLGFGAFGGVGAEYGRANERQGERAEGGGLEKLATMEGVLNHEDVLSFGIAVVQPNRSVLRGGDRTTSFALRAPDGKRRLDSGFGSRAGSNNRRELPQIL